MTNWKRYLAATMLFLFSLLATGFLADFFCYVFLRIDSRSDHFNLALGINFMITLLSLVLSSKLLPVSKRPASVLISSTALLLFFAVLIPWQFSKPDVTRVNYDILAIDFVPFLLAMFLAWLHARYSAASDAAPAHQVPS